MSGAAASTPAGGIPSAPPVPPSPAPVTIDTVRSLGLRVARVEEVSVHPNADRLYVLKVRAGSEVRQVVAGIRSQYTPEQLTGRLVVVVWNLKPAMLRGVESQGMILATAAGDTISLVAPDREVEPGAEVR